MEKDLAETSSKAALGVQGLDDITAGGLARGRLYLLEGSPGTGKTTIATQFLMAGAAAGESALYITLSETEDELRASAASHGWSFDGIDIFELVPPESLLDEDQQQSLLLFRSRTGRNDQAHLRVL
jgi:circadian clock protein KaiC